MERRVLGADDKAGVAEIMTLAEALLAGGISTWADFHRLYTG